MPDFRYFPNTEADIKRIYKFIGIKDKQELFGKIVGDVPLINVNNLETLLNGLDELSLFRRFFNIDSELFGGKGLRVFAGGGVYNHFVPSAIDSLISRAEFYTPYTPYQPEVSQGTLLALFEFQSMVAEITGMDVVNASMYDGAESLAEAVLMSLRIYLSANPQVRNKDAESADYHPHSGHTVLVSEGVSPAYLSVVKTYAGNIKARIETIKLNKKTGQTDLDGLKSMLKGNISSVVIQHPNFFGILEDLEAIEPAVHGFDPRPVFIVSSSEPLSFGIINPPGYCNADIFAGEGNSFGNYMNFGGPLLGIFGTKKEYVRQMPGRIVGKTKDSAGKDAYAFILATREQHIRRGAATSNICTNNSLNAVRAAIYLSLCSKKGFSELSLLNIKLAHILYEKLVNTGLFEPLFSGAFFNEFALRLKNKGKNISSEKFINIMADRGILAGVKISEDAMLIACTENNGMPDIEAYIENSKDILK